MGTVHIWQAPHEPGWADHPFCVAKVRPSLLNEHVETSENAPRCVDLQESHRLAYRKLSIAYGLNVVVSPDENVIV